MNEQWGIRWSEFRWVHDVYELYFVEAKESDHGWQFQEQSTWEQRSYRVSRFRLTLIAEHLKQEIKNGSIATTGTLYVDMLETPHYVEFQLRREMRPVSRRTEPKRSKWIYAEVKLRSWIRSQLIQPGQARWDAA